MARVFSFLVSWFLLIAVERIDSVGIKKILVFGGNGLIGAASVDRLLEQGHDLTLLTRGNWYWDTAETIKPLVKHVKCDRMKRLNDCWNGDVSKHFDAIVDFSGFDPYMIKDAVEFFKGKIGRYIYISSDSVYEVCEKNHDGLTVEADSVRPTDLKQQKMLNKKDDYGHRKYAGEEVLMQQRKAGGMPYFFLRLPDVIGSRDNTHRWWVYQAWLRISPYLDTKVTVPKSLENYPMSFVFVEDVADIVLKSLDYETDLLDEAYNFACDETPTLPDILNTMKKYMKKEEIEIEINDNEDVVHLFPSVTRGPINCDKAKQKLNFKPTSFEEAAKQTIEFYEKAISNKKYDKERFSLVKTLETFSSENVQSVYIALKEEYDVDLRSRDEL